MRHGWKLFSFFFILILTQCGRPQNFDDGTVKDSTNNLAPSSHIVQSHEEFKKQAIATLDRVAVAFNKSGKDDAPDLLIRSEYSACKSLSVIAAALDKTSSFQNEIKEETNRLIIEDSTRVGKAGKITNGMLGLYGYYSILYRMRFIDNEEMMQNLSAMNTKVVQKIKPDIAAIEAVSIMAQTIYLFTTAIMKNIDTEGLYVDAFTQIEKQYKEGDETAQTDEDRFLNGVYRTFEVSQLWALFLAPESRNEISDLNKDLYKRNANVTDIGMQMAVAMEYLYRINDLIARKTLEVAR